MPPKGKLMPAYSVEIEHRKTDQVFSTYKNDAMLHFNVSLLARLHKQMSGEFRKITMNLDEAVYELCVKHRGIEEPKVEALTATQLREPGYGVMFSDGLFTIVDGHHRLVRRWRGGCRTMDFWVTHQHAWEPCIIKGTAEEDAEIAKGMPVRVLEPGLVTSSVALHDPEPQL
jgi:hypothetical protein